MLRTPIALWLGAISYCLYLVNEPVQRLLGSALARMVNGDGALFTALWLPAATLIPLVAAAALHRWIEQPALHRSRTIKDGKPPVTTLRRAQHGI
jgi:peptidoglycan/LPS O-acetylase OafA/YrhL